MNLGDRRVYVSWAMEVCSRAEEGGRGWEEGGVATRDMVFCPV